MGATGSKQDVGEERGDEDEGSNMYIPSSETEPLLKPLKGLSPPLVLLPPIPHSLFQHLGRCNYNRWRELFFFNAISNMFDCLSSPVDQIVDKTDFESR